MWIRNGTVEVTQGSATVQGTDTNWTDAKESSEFILEGETQRLEILNIVSDTEIELSLPIARASASGLTYQIMPTQGLELEIRRRLTEIVTLNEGLSADFVAQYVKPPKGFSFQNLAINGVFDTDTDWVKGTGWTIGVGEATKVSGTTAALVQDISAVVALGRRYYCSAQVTRNAGSLAASLVGGGGSDVFFTASASGLAEGATTATVQRTDVNLNGSATFDGVVDDVALWEANPDNDAPWLRLPYGMTLDAYGWVVRDGVVLSDDDFEVRTTADPKQNFVEPATTPGASSRFQVFCSEVQG